GVVSRRRREPLVGCTVSTGHRARRCGRHDQKALVLGCFAKCRPAFAGHSDGRARTGLWRPAPVRRAGSCDRLQRRRDSHAAWRAFAGRGGRGTGRLCDRSKSADRDHAAYHARPHCGGDGMMRGIWDRETVALLLLAALLPLAITWLLAT